jgi:hypothetical protein
VPTTRALFNRRAYRTGVELIAPNAMERCFPSLALEHSVIPTIVPQPEREEDGCDQEAENHRSNGQIEHERRQT